LAWQRPLTLASNTATDEPIRIEIVGRPLYEECLVLGVEFLIGQTALEKTAPFVDCIGGRLVPNPDHPDTVIMPVR
jgi:hypothetical protein